MCFSFLLLLLTDILLSNLFSLLRLHFLFGIPYSYIYVSFHMYSCYYSYIYNFWNTANTYIHVV